MEQGSGVCVLALIAVSRAELDKITAALKDNGLVCLASWQGQGGGRAWGPPLHKGTLRLARQEAVGEAVAGPPCRAVQRPSEFRTIKAN